MNASESEGDDNMIRLDDYVIVQRQGYTKLHKLKKQSKLNLGNFLIDVSNVRGERYFDTFQMKKDSSSGHKNFYILEKVEDISSVTELLNTEPSGIDNRHIPNNADSQGLTKDDIDKLKEDELSSNNIVEQLISNSKTFSMKTGYSQEKYIKKKEKKYFEYIQIRKPTIRILVQMFYRQDPTKTLGIRVDDLSQILTYANIHQQGNHLLYDSGTSGLMPASIINAVGANTEGHLIHMHPGNECQKNAFVAMQFPQEQFKRCINVNIYSVLRRYYQNKRTKCGVNVEENTEPQDDVKTDNISNSEEVEDEPSTKRMKLDDTIQKKTWELENERACEILEDKVDSLIITAKEHPVNIVKELISFLHGNRNLVVFSLLKEPLQDLYFYLKSRTDIICIKLLNNFMRNYQVLPDRTHPEVNMTTGGYILTAIKLNC